MSKRRQFNDSEIIDVLKEFYNEQGLTSEVVYTASGYKPSSRTIAKRFGSWHNALRLASIPVKKREKRSFESGTSMEEKKDKAIRSLKDCFEKHGAISITIYNQNKYRPHSESIYKIFGSWENALQEAGLPSNKPSIETIKQQAITQIKECYEENGGNVNVRIYEHSGRAPRINTIYKYFGSWNSAMEKAGLTVKPSNKSYTDEDCLDAIRSIAEKSGGYITKILYEESKQKPHIEVILRRFGSWSEAVRKAGFEPNRGSEKKYTEKEIISVIRRAFAENNGYCSKEMYTEQNRLPITSTIDYYLGSWEEAVKMANIQVEKDVRRYSKKDVLNALYTCYKENHDYISPEFYKQSTLKPSYNTIVRMFGSWKEALDVAGFDVTNRNPTFYKKEDVLLSLLNSYKKFGNDLSSQLYIRAGIKPTITVIQTLFGSWNEALHEAGLEQCIRQYYDSENYTKQECIKAIQEVADGRETITSEEYRASGNRPRYKAILTHFESWNDAIEMAGLKPVPRYKGNLKNVSKEDCIESIRDFFNTCNGHFTQLEYRKEKRQPGVRVIIRLFGSWNQAVESAGIKPNLKRK